MSKLDSIREKIGWLKIYFGILAAMDISLLAWLAENFSTGNRNTLLICLLGLVVLSSGLIKIILLAYRYIKELEEL